MKIMRFHILLLHREETFIRDNSPEVYLPQNINEEKKQT